MMLVLHTSEGRPGFSTANTELDSAQSRLVFKLGHTTVVGIFKHILQLRQINKQKLIFMQFSESTKSQLECLICGTNFHIYLMQQAPDLDKV